MATKLNSASILVVFHIIMAGLKIEGNLDNVSEPQLEYIKKVIEKFGFKDAKVLIEPVGKAEDNFVANVMRLVIEDKNGGILKMIAKVAPTSEAIRKAANTDLMFENEHVMYTKVLPKFEQIQEEANIPAEERLRVAKLYGSFNVAPNEVIILEDLNESGFVMLDKFKSLTDEYAKNILKNLALYHSLSYVLKSKEPEVFEEFKNDLQDLWLQNLASREETMQSLIRLESHALMMMTSDIHKKAMKGIMSKTIKTIIKYSKSNKESKHAIIQQGDPWTNNIMFKIDEENQLQSIMIDYQMSKVTNPVCDLHYMLFNCTDYETRKASYNDWLDYYHDQLDKSLSPYGLKASFTYPRDQLDADLKRHGNMSLGISILSATIQIRQTKEADQLKEAMKSANTEEVKKLNLTDSLGMESIMRFKSKVEGLINSHLELGYL